MEVVANVSSANVPSELDSKALDICLAKEGVFDTLRTMSLDELKSVATCIRKRILEVVSTNGGHLSSTLGAVDLIIGMHAVFDVAKHFYL